MQELLTGKKRLEGFSGEWEEVRPGDFGTFLKGSGVRKDQAQSGDIPCVRYGELYTLHEDVIREFASFISEEVARTATPLKRGDVLFAGSGETKEEIGKCASFTDNFSAFAGGDIVIFRPTKSVSSYFLGYYCNSPAIVSQKASMECSPKTGKI